MKTTIVRVTREYSVCVVESTDITVLQDDDASEYPRPTDLAETLVKAQLATGQDIDWKHVSENVLSYPVQSFDTEIVSGGAFVDVTPAPEPPPVAPVATDAEILF